MELFGKSNSYIPLYSGYEKKKIFHIPYKIFAVTTVTLPLIGFTLCVLLSIFKDFERSTFTHCNVFNFLPSVSAAIGSFYPQNLIWKITIAVHSLPRYFITFLYYQHYKNLIRRTVHLFVFVTTLLNAVEITSLIGLSFWSSSENYPVHKSCFITFVATSELYMLFSCILLKRHKRAAPTDIEAISLKLKWSLLLINVSSFLSAGYFFMRHNTYCEPMVYSLFAASEYIVILTNMGFHMTSCYDFFGRDIILKNLSIGIN